MFAVPTAYSLPPSTKAACVQGSGRDAAWCQVPAGQTVAMGTGLLSTSADRATSGRPAHAETRKVYVLPASRRTTSSELMPGGAPPRAASGADALGHDVSG